MSIRSAIAPSRVSFLAMTVSFLSEVIFALMLFVSPPEQFRTSEPDAQETVEARASRYVSISNALAEVVIASEASAPIFNSSIVLAITWHESGWNRDVDEGIKRGDHGRSWCLGQINIGDGSIYGFDGPSLVADHYACLYVSHRIAHASLRACRKDGHANWLAQYASGSCKNGREASAIRMRTASAFYDHMVRIKREIEGYARAED